jgi:hypothetical protein
MEFNAIGSGNWNLFHREIPGFQRHLHYKNGLAWFGFMVLITTFNNISAILCITCQILFFLFRTECKITYSHDH